LQEAYSWYGKKKTGLGEEFPDEFEETINRVKRNPFHASFSDDRWRSATLKRFPYEIIYLIDEPNLKYIL
jgi:hypothetical protein